MNIHPTKPRIFQWMLTLSFVFLASASSAGALALWRFWHNGSTSLSLEEVAIFTLGAYITVLFVLSAITDHNKKK